MKKGVKITGKWGYGDGLSATPYQLTAITIVADNATELELDVSAEGVIEAGHTILVEAEQMYVTAVTSNASKKITVVRGVNGTTGIAHATKLASTYRYPDDIMQVCLMIAERLFETRGKAFASEKLGDYSYTLAKGGLIDAEMAILLPYKMWLL